MGYVLLEGSMMFVASFSWRLDARPPFFLKKKETAANDSRAEFPDAQAAPPPFVPGEALVWEAIFMEQG